ncbi:glycoside hydrolase family 31 protein [Streptomyces sp. NPDC055749]
MDGRDLVRSVKMVGSVQGLRTARTAWRHRRADARALPPRGAERARVPGLLTGADPGPGGGVVRFARSELRVRVAAGGAVFWAWDGAEPLPSYALPGAEPEPDPRAALEPDKDGGWQVVSERLTVVVSRHGAVELRTPGGLVLRRELPPRWWEPVAGGEARWVLRSEVPADARFFGLGGQSRGPRLRDGTYRLWNPGPGGSPGSGDGLSCLAMPVQLVVADAGTHLVFHDNSWSGRVTLREGEEGAGSGHDRPGTCEVRMDGGPLRCWVVAGTPARVLRGWTALTGAPALPPSWALGAQHAGSGSGGSGSGGEEEVRRIVAGYRERELPLSVLHLDGDTGGGERFPGLPRLAKELRADGVRLVSVVGAAVEAEPGNAVFDSGRRIGTGGAYVEDAGGRWVRGAGRPGARVYPDFTDPLVREWWGALYEERLDQGFSGVWHDVDEPGSFPAVGGAGLPLSARHALEGRGGDHREAHNVYGLAMARAGYEGLRRLRPDERPFLVSRSGWTGVQRYGGVWSGDAVTGWAGLRVSLARVLGLGLCGVPYSGPDGDGVEGAPPSPSAELYLRRLQLGAYLPLFRTRAAVGADGREPWEFGPEVLEHAKAVLDGRERLHPYFVTLSQVARLTGAPYVRPLWWGAPGDRTLRDCEDAFLLGDALLVAPVLACGAERRAVRLPRGRWYDTVTEEAYEGPGQVLVDAPLSRIPVLARAGAVIPVRGPDGVLELEVWAPPVGRTGGGLVVRDAGDGWARAEVERYTSRRSGGRVVVERDGGEGEAVPAVRVRGL